MIPCKNCGALNPIDRILCLKCGKPLDKAGPEALQNMEIPLQKDLHILKENLAGTLFTWLFSWVFFIVLFVSLYFFFYSGNIPEPVLSLSSARNLDQKILLLTKGAEPYVPLTQEEVNIHLEREWSRAKDSITAVLPSYIQMNRIFISLHEHDLTLYLHFMIRKIPIFISFTGILDTKNQEIRLILRKSAVGALRLPLVLTQSLIKPILRECLDHKRFVLPYGIQSLDISNTTLFAYKNPDSRGSSKPGAEAAIPSDLLLVQAADVCLSKNEREKAEKYLRLALIHHPASPLKSYILDQLKLCTGEKGEDA